MLAASALAASGAELRGAWSAVSGGLNLAGTWTAEAHREGGVVGTWTLRDAAGRTLMGGGWSASKAPQAWSGAWRATIVGRAGEYVGTWTSATPLARRAPLEDMLESALNALVTGTWKTGVYSGSWSIRASP